MRVCAYGAERSIHAQRARLRLAVKRFRLAKNFCRTPIKLWDARPWTPELKADYEARGLLEFHSNKLKTQPGSSQATLEQALITNATISEPVRRRALEWAPAFWKASSPESP